MRVLLDTNVWSYVADHAVGDEVAKLLTSRGVVLVLPPSLLVEVLALRRADVRDRIIQTITSAKGTRLRSEADLEAAEVISLIRRSHPGWMRPVPDRALQGRLREFWTNRFWKEARRDSTRLHAYTVSHTRELDILRGTQKRARDEYLRSRLSELDLNGLTAEVAGETKLLLAPDPPFVV